MPSVDWYKPAAGVPIKTGFIRWSDHVVVMHFFLLQGEQLAKPGRCHHHG